MARLLPYVLLQIDVIHDKYLNTCRRPVTSGGNGGYGHKRLAASFVVVLFDCYVHAEIVTFLCERSQFIRTKRLTTERDRERVPEADTLAVALPRSLGRESVFGLLSSDVLPATAFAAKRATMRGCEGTGDAATPI